MMWIKTITICLDCNNILDEKDGVCCNCTAAEIKPQRRMLTTTKGVRIINDFFIGYDKIEVKGENIKCECYGELTKIYEKDGNKKFMCMACGNKVTINSFWKVRTDEGIRFIQRGNSVNNGDNKGNSTGARYYREKC